jgi:hypothetical protein
LFFGNEDSFLFFDSNVNNFFELPRAVTRNVRDSALKQPKFGLRLPN